MASKRWNNAAAAPQEPVPRPMIINIAQANEPIARALGMALVLQWDALPDAMQDLLIDQAVLSSENSENALTNSRVENFIRGAKAVAAPAPIVQSPEQA